MNGRVATEEDEVNETHPYHQSRSVKAYIAEDYDIFDFSLTPDDMQRIRSAT